MRKLATPRRFPLEGRARRSSGAGRETKPCRLHDCQTALSCGERIVFSLLFLERGCQEQMLKPATVTGYRRDESECLPFERSVLNCFRQVRGRDGSASFKISQGSRHFEDPGVSAGRKAQSIDGRREKAPSLRIERTELPNLAHPHFCVRAQATG